VRLKAINTTLTDEQFIVHVLINLTSKYNNQVKNLEKKIGSSVSPLMIEEVSDESSLQKIKMTIKGLNAGVISVAIGATKELTVTPKRSQQVTKSHRALSREPATTTELLDT
jgi:hypothetical protein